MKPLISIIVPIYNAELYIQRCLKSLIKQSYYNLEIVLVNDGSTDNSQEICLQMANQDDRIKYFYKSNGGQASARNYGLDKATGAYIAFVDNDDIVSPNFIELLYKDISEYKTNVVGCSNLTIENEREINKYQGLKTGLYSTEFFIHHILRQTKWSWGTVWNKLYSSSIKKLLYFPDGHEYEDYLVNIRIFSFEKYVYFRNEPLYFWIRRKDSQSNRAYHIGIETGLNTVRQIQQILHSHGSYSLQQDSIYFECLVLYHIIRLMYKSGINNNRKKYIRNFKDNISNNPRFLLSPKIISKLSKIKCMELQSHLKEIYDK